MKYRIPNFAHIGLVLSDILGFDLKESYMCPLKTQRDCLNSQNTTHISFIWSNSVQDFDLRRSWKYSFPRRLESKERGWTNTVYIDLHFCREINLIAITCFLGGTLDKIWWEGAQKHFIGLGNWGLPRPPNNCPLIDYAKIQFFLARLVSTFDQYLYIWEPY